jgi:hypothetical protein
MKKAVNRSTKSRSARVRVLVNSTDCYHVLGIIHHVDAAAGADQGLYREPSVERLPDAAYDRVGPAGQPRVHSLRDMHRTAGMVSRLYKETARLPTSSTTIFRGSGS